MGRKSLLLIGSISYCLLFCFALLFYKERMAFTDAACHLFCILKDGDFAFQNYRYVAFFTQGFPLLAAKLSLPLMQAAQLYSLSFVLLYALTFFILLLGFKNERLSLCWLLFCVLMPRLSFYWCLSEVHQGAAFFFIYLGFLLRLLEGKSNNLFVYLLMAVLLFIVALAHPLIPFLVMFVWVFLYLQYTSKKKIFLINAAFLVLVYLGKSLLFNTQNDAGATANLFKGLMLFPHYFDIPSNKKFIKYFIFDYYWVSTLFVVVMAWYVRHKKILKAALLLFAFVGYAFINNISEPYGPVQFYEESRYIFLSAFVIFPFVFDVLPQFKNWPYTPYILSILVLFCVSSIYRYHHKFTERVVWNEEIIKHTEHRAEKKLIIPVDKVPMDLLEMAWGTSYEVWLLSTINEGKTRSIIIKENDGEFEAATHSFGSFQAKWGLMAYESFPKQYFKFVDTTTTYVYY